MKQIKPMLIKHEQPPFDDDDYIYELKLDGIRCIAHLTKTSTDLRNKRTQKLLPKFPELTQLHKQIKKSCILDGELYIFKDGITDFFEIQKRTLMSNPFKISLASKQYPATFTAFDILEIDGECVTHEPLIKRKQLLQSVVKENERFNIARYIEKEGIKLFTLTQEKGLEGIVAKRKDSLYYPDKRTNDWIKCKNSLDDDFIIVGYLLKEKGIVSLILAQYDKQHLKYMGHVTLGVSLSLLNRNIQKTTICPFSTIPPHHEDANWITPFLVGTVKFMQYTETGGLRQPIFKGFRNDKTPQECIIK